MGNIHAGHRDRVREEYLRSGLDGFSDVKVLEFLLFYSPQAGDVNPVAHALIDEFGSLDAVLDASAEEINRRTGLNMRTAILISSVMQIAKRHDMAADAKKWKTLSGTSDAGEFFIEQFKRMTEENFMVVCLDGSNTVISSKILSSGSADSVNISIRKIAGTALKLNASAVMIAHNHPDGNVTPSDEDRASTGSISAALAPLGIRLLDHIIVSGDSYFSFVKEGIMPIT